MPIQKLKEKLYKSSRFDEIFEYIKDSNTVRCRGLAYSLQTFFLSYLHEEKQKKVLYLGDSVESCEKMRDDMALILDNNDTEILLPSENYPYCSSGIDDERKGNRLLALDRIYSNDYGVILSTYRNLFEKLPKKSDFSDFFLDIRIGKELDIDKLKAKLTDFGFEKVTTVENIGEFSGKGSIFDIYPYASEYPLRIEFFDTEVESIRFFDPINQKKTSEEKSVTIYLSDVKGAGDSSNLLNLIDNDTIIFIDDCDNVADKLKAYYDEHIVEGYLRQKSDDKINYTKKYYDTAVIENLLNPKKKIFDLISDKGYDFKVNVKDQGSYRYDFKSFITSLRNDAEKGYYSYIMCDNPGQAERFVEILEEDCFDFSRLKVVVGGLHQGFIYPDAKIAVYTDHQIFGRIKRPRNFRRFKKPIPLKEIKRLNYGDYIVHIDHGIGQFLGLEKITVAGAVRDVIKLLYRNNDLLYVKLDHLHLIQKYSAADGIMPVLSKIGGKQFKNTKERTKKSIKSIARELIGLYAKRKEASGFAFPGDTIWQTEMEASFEYEDTPDQAKATKDFKKDMESVMPMDRLVCGDVGFGKTEIAIRAAFKSAISGKQVAVLAPTTILVHQHFENFKKRMEKYPIKLDYLSRFKTRMEQSATISDLEEGKVDIVIGTHRLLSKDVVFKDLGMLIIDEEQRFGVKHKEKVKEFKVNVDVLTLTATPIPRTLHMSLLGVRDLSLINTPPTNRLPIITEIHPYNEDIIFEGIMKEVDRGGQVFFLHNRVETIESMKFNLQKIVPDVSIAVAHGQMKPKALETIMLDFMYKRYDVLICSTIIESGVDIPNVNTLIVNNADRFGISQLYQIRGRIGRSHRQAYAYFLTPTTKALSPVARKRLDTVSEFTDLGSGFQIAMKDLEIRGAGNLLGGEQSGFIENVGFELYTKILEEAVQELKEEEFNEILTNIEITEKVSKTIINLKGKVYLPEAYIEDNSERVEIYRRLMNCRSGKELEELRLELKDRFGSEPREARNLFDNLQLALVGGKLLIKSISYKDSGYDNWYLKFVFDKEQLMLAENAKIGMMLQKNIINLTNRSDVQTKFEKDGEIIYFYPRKAEVVNDFIYQCIDMLKEE